MSFAIILVYARINKIVKLSQKYEDFCQSSYFYTHDVGIKYNTLQ